MNYCVYIPSISKRFVNKELEIISYGGFDGIETKQIIQISNENSLNFSNDLPYNPIGCDEEHFRVFLVGFNINKTRSTRIELIAEKI